MQPILSGVKDYRIRKPSGSHGRMPLFTLFEGYAEAYRETLER